MIYYTEKRIVTINASEDVIQDRKVTRGCDLLSGKWELEICICGTYNEDKKLQWRASIEHAVCNGDSKDEEIDSSFKEKGSQWENSLSDKASDACESIFNSFLGIS